jgi:hypothetical protein
MSVASYQWMGYYWADVCRSLQVSFYLEFITERCGLADAIRSDRLWRLSCHSCYCCTSPNCAISLIMCACKFFNILYLTSALNQDRQIDR